LKPRIPIEAKLKASLAGLGEGFECTAELLSDAARDQIPESMMGR
jgi:hypothetical protein